MSELTIPEIKALSSLMAHEGWEVFKSVVNDDIASAYRSFRDCDESKMRRLQGRIEGLELSINSAETIINEFVEEVK